MVYKYDPHILHKKEDVEQTEEKLLSSQKMIVLTVSILLES
jgi:hypothetical protein